MTVDAGNLWNAAQSGVLQGVDSKVLTSNVPASLRDPANQWFGFSVRARTIAYSTEEVKPVDLKATQDLADPKWKGRLCLRTSKSLQSVVVAMMIAELAKENRDFGKIMGGNLATKVFSNDTKLLKAIAWPMRCWNCEYYYFARLAKKIKN